MALTADYVYDAMRRFSQSTGFIEPGSRDEVLAMLDAGGSFAIGEDNKGLIIGYVAPSLFNPQVLVAFEQMWWVEPKHRNTPYAIRLLAQFEAYAKKHGASRIIMSAIERSNDVAINLYPRLGYFKLETTFTKEI